MTTLLQGALPWLVLASNIFAAVFLVALLFKKTFGRDLVEWVGRHALSLGLLISLGAVFGSLFYSNIVGFEPCYLCWWQRIAIYPLLVLFLVALYKKDRGAFSYVLPLSLMGLLLSIYHSYIQWGGNPLIPCDAAASCDKLYVYEFGYITIPTMVLSIAVLYILLYFANKTYEDSHS
jgi:disulfide bond formation protein DsbB